MQAIISPLKSLNWWLIGCVRWIGKGLSAQVSAANIRASSLHLPAFTIETCESLFLFTFSLAGTPATKQWDATTGCGTLLNRFATHSFARQRYLRRYFCSAR